MGSIPSQGTYGRQPINVSLSPSLSRINNASLGEDLKNSIFCSITLRSLNLVSFFSSWPILSLLLCCSLRATEEGLHGSCLSSPPTATPRQRGSSASWQLNAVRCVSCALRVLALLSESPYTFVARFCLGLLDRSSYPLFTLSLCSL